MPAVLLLWQPPLEPEGLEVLREIAPRGAGSRVLLAGKHDLEHPAKWQPLLKLKPGGENLNARTVPEGVLLPAAFLAGTRKSPYPGAANLIQWAQKNSGQDEFSTAFYIGSQAGELSLLEDLARFPGLTRPELNRLNPQAKSGRRLEGRLLSLRQAGLVAETHEGQILVAERGLNLLAGLRGVSRQSANRYLGWPVRKKGFQGVLSHQGAVLEFMLRLRDEGALYAWDFNSARFLFWRSGANPGGRPLVIVPDTAAALIFGPDRLARFWLELDRGTSRGKRLAWKLEKYFLASIARLASAKIPPLLIVIDRDGWREENRLQKIARLLKVLGCKYPASPLLALLTTGDLLRGASAPLLEVRLWRVFTGGRLETGLVSLREGLGCGRA